MMKIRYMRNIKKVLVDLNSNKKYFIKDLDDNFHTSNGVISKEQMNGSETLVKSDKGRKFVVLEPSFVDLWENLKRGPQIMQQKDVGIVLAKTGVNRNSRVVDAGGGSGSMCLSFANICKDVYVYEINPEHYDVIQKNVQAFGIDNLHLKQENVYNGIVEKNIDVINLDLPEPWQAVNTAEKALKDGGFLVVYLPNLGQVKQFIDACKGTRFRVLETLELLERKWKIQDRIMRPEFEMLGHTGFLTFCRKF